MKLQYLSLFFLLTAASCGQKKSSHDTTESSQDPNLVSFSESEMNTGGITVGPPEKGMASAFIKVSGVISVPPQNRVSISFPSGGYLHSTNLVQGKRVRKGEAIATMQDQSLIQLQQDFLVAQTKVEFLKKEYDRQKALNETKTTSDKAFEQVESEYRTQRIQMNSLRERLILLGIDPASLHEGNIRRSINIYSPIDGYVSAINVNVGKYVDPGEIMFELINSNDLILELRVFEKDIPSISIGQRVKANIVNQSSETYEATIQLISKSLDENRSAIIQCRFEQAPANLIPGMFANAVIELKSNEAILVPEDAIVRWGNEHYVFLERGDQIFEMTRVDVGSTEAGKSEIKPGVITESDRIIIKNAYAALMKLHNRAED